MIVLQSGFFLESQFYNPCSKPLSEILKVNVAELLILPFANVATSAFDYLETISWQLFSAAQLRQIASLAESCLLSLTLASRYLNCHLPKRHYGTHRLKKLRVGLQHEKTSVSKYALPHSWKVFSKTRSNINNTRRTDARGWWGYLSVGDIS